MSDEARAREERARRRSETWKVESLSDSPPAAPAKLSERLELLEQLRRLGFALQGVPYPEGPTPRHERRKWSVERLG